MKCAACKYDDLDSEFDENGKYHELFTKIDFNDLLTVCPKLKGKPIDLMVCPKCGTVKVEV